MKNTKKLEKYDLRKLSPKIYREFFISLVIFMIPVALFTYLAKEVFENETLAIDTAILKFINAKSLPILDRTVPWITKGSGGIVIGSFFILICIYYYFKKEFHNIIFLTLTLPGTSILNTVLKLIFKRERPNLWNLLVKETFYSFPSGHAMISTALVLSIIIICYHTKYFKPSLIIGIIFLSLIHI